MTDVPDVIVRATGTFMATGPCFTQNAMPGAVEPQVVVSDVESEKTITDRSNEKRATWSNRFEFLLSCVGYSVGLGNMYAIY